jgi:hypothetical protein
MTAAQDCALLWSTRMNSTRSDSSAPATDVRSRRRASGRPMVEHTNEMSGPLPTLDCETIRAKYH